MRERVERLAAIERGSASPGERVAAELIAEELGSLGARVRLEEEQVHGTYWWPLGILAALGALGGFARRRAIGVAAGALAAAGAWDDLRLNRRALRRRLPQRRAVNVVAELGDENAEHTVLVMAHHDAAHAGLVFHPEIPRSIGRRFPGLIERSDTTPPAMWGTVGGPALVALGSAVGGRFGRGVRRLGGVISAGYIAAMADIGVRRVVPAANDNATGVAVLLSLARAFSDEPPPGLRIMLLSTGSEESILEGMEGFARRHFGELPRDRTHVINVDTVGSPHLLLLEGEGMLGIREYPKDFLALVRACARELGIYIYPNLRFRNATDGVVALKAGYPTVMLGSVDEFKAPTHYHWPSDVPENVDFDRVADAARLVEAVVRRLAVQETFDQTPAEART